MYMRMETLTETATIRIDQQTLAGIYEKFSPALYRYACRLLGDQDQAEECVAETFSRFLGSLRGGRAPDNVQAYLYRIAHNWITDQYRRAPAPESLDHDGMDDIYADPQQNPAGLAQQNLEQNRLREALRRLPPDQRQVVVLRFLEELSHEEAAGVLGKNVEATRALQHRALAALRRMLIEEEE
jgi:RNA polymerase sigma-70 factor, ECF subfamily